MFSTSRASRWIEGTDADHRVGSAGQAETSPDPDPAVHAPPAELDHHRAHHSTIRGITSEVPVRPRNGLDHDSVVSCDNITTVRLNAVGDTIGLFLNDQEPALAVAIGDAFDLSLP